MAAHGYIQAVPGFEDIAAAEVSELLGVAATVAGNGLVEFDVKKASDLVALSYLSQSAGSVFMVDGKKRIPLHNPGEREYAVFGNGELSGSMAYSVLRASGYDGSLFDPFTANGSLAIEAALFSSGFPVHYYRKDALISSLSGLPQFNKVDFPAVFSAAGKARRRKKPVILCSSESMQNVRFAEKNAKIAGINKVIRFSRLDIKWLDAKLGERSISLVVSFPPQLKGSGIDSYSFSAAENDRLVKLYKDFFCQADFFLKKAGRVVLILNKPSRIAAESAAAAYKFQSQILRQFQIGKAPFELVSFAIGDLSKPLKAFPAFQPAHELWS